jgi:cell division septum initiation protein DivIVA
MKDDRGNLDLTRQIEDLKKKVREAEGETSLVKAIGINSPEMRALKAENEELKAELARAKEDHQYDNLVHRHELESLKNPLPSLRKKGF